VFGSWGCFDRAASEDAVESDFMKLKLGGSEGMRALAGLAGLGQRSCEACGKKLEAYSKDPQSRWSCHACRIEGCTTANLADEPKGMS